MAPARTALVLSPLVLAALTMAVGCDEARPDVQAAASASQEPSPNASIKPEPLASAPPEGDDGRSVGASGSAIAPGPSASASAVASAAPSARPPTTVREDRPIAPDRSEAGARFEIVADLAWPDRPAATGPYVALSARSGDLPKAATEVVLDSEGRLQMTFRGRGLPFPDGTAIGTRADLLGHLLIWPNRNRYRPLPAGAVRALLGERRLDAGRPGTATAKRLDGEGRWLEQPTVLDELTSDRGKMVIEQTDSSRSGRGGEQLCRLFLAVFGSQPVRPICRPGRLPLKVTFAWEDAGRLTWTGRRLRDLPLVPRLRVPPASASFERDAVPTHLSQLVDGDLLKSLAPIRPAPPPGRQAPDDDQGAPVPAPAGALAPAGSGLGVVNEADDLAYLLIDGVVVALMEPRRRLHLRELPDGVHRLAWMSFLGDRLEASREVIVPGTTVVPTADDEAEIP